MTSVAEFTLPVAEFPLGTVFERWPDVRLELDRVVPSGDTVWPYFWVQTRDGDCDLEAVRTVFDDLPELRSAVLMEDLGDRGLFRAEWKPEYLGIMSAIEATGVTVLSATGTSDGWMFELRATAVEQFSEFRQRCRGLDLNVSLARLSRLSEMTDPAEHNLTPEQHEALVLAYDHGYYDDPSNTDQETLASQLGISRQALSARLRRGYRNLIESTLIHGPQDGEI